MPVHCGDQRHLGMCLGYVPALTYCSYRVSDQGTVLRASDLYNARAPILNSFNKHLRVDFEINHKRARYDVISTYLCLSKRQCMMKCAADARCTAYNFSSGYGFCEVLPIRPKCYDPDDDDDFVFTQLKLPDFKPLMAKQSKPPETRDLQWVPCNWTTAPSPSNIWVTNDGYVGLGFHKDMYLPAFCRGFQNTNKTPLPCRQQH